MLEDYGSSRSTRSSRLARLARLARQSRTCPVESSRVEPSGIWALLSASFTAFNFQERAVHNVATKLVSCDKAENRSPGFGLKPPPDHNWWYVTVGCCWYCKTLSEWSNRWIGNSRCSFVRTFMYFRRELQCWIWGKCYYWLYWWQYLSTVMF